MKKTAVNQGVIFLFLLQFLFLAGCVTTYNHATPEKLGKTVFKILKNQDDAALHLVVPAESDLESFLATSDMPEDELAAFKEEMKQIIAEFLNAATIAYQGASDAASHDGVVLSKSKLGKARVKTWQGPDNMLSDIEMDLAYGGKKYLLKIHEAGKVASGWVVGLKGFELVSAGQ